MPATVDPAAQTDVIVIGGGPAGSTVATLLAKRGWRVALFEKERHPRFHIGESLLPMNMPIIERLGLMDELRAIGVKKVGADFEARNERGYGTFEFSRALGDSPPYAFQVRRDEFDEMLFRDSAKHGVQAFECARVSDVAFDGDGVTVTVATPDGERPWRAKQLVDATGRDTFLASRFKLKRKHSKHQSAALFAHFTGVERRKGEHEGNVSIYQFEHGWLWFIPLRNDVMSVGAVCWPEYLKRRQGRTAEFLLETIALVPAAQARMRDAKLVDHLHVTGNFSYVSSRMWGPRWLLAGDAFAFVDPVFSSGVFLAMHGAEKAAATLDEVLRDPATEARAKSRFDAEVRRGLEAFSWFIFRFTTPAMRRLFANPRNAFGVEQAMISMLAGDVFDNPRVRSRLRIFKAIYYATAFRMFGSNLKHYFRRRRQLGERFTGGTTTQDHA
ncbi:MAG TPA: NAD(P)/FAD-dependent oxidoreductase [Xanthomonadales bacterium]|nr:NAD(P)/FAD-dependent oxidoreductase [Xanthomonadales bacterium]